MPVSNCLQTATVDKYQSMPRLTSCLTRNSTSFLLSSRRPLKALTVFIDASGASHKSVMTWRNPQTQHWEADVEFAEGSPQVAKLNAVVRAFEKFSEPINLVTDSAYVAGVVSRVEQAVLKDIENEQLFRFLSKLIYLISQREHLFYVMHVRSHTDLPGEIAEGNPQADSLPILAEKARLPHIFQEAKLSHQQYHQNVSVLIHQFQLTQSQAQATVATCPSCQLQAMPSLSNGVKLQGLGSCEVWQTDIAHIPSFGCLKYVHISIDTYSGAVYASAHAGERAVHAKQHLVQAFSVLGIPKEIKIDNGPAYVSKEFLEFVQQWGVKHKTGIPHSPTGQAVIEHAHQTLKQVLARQSSPTVWMSPQQKLCKALFTINFLNCSFENMSPPVECHFNSGVLELHPVPVQSGSVHGRWWGCFHPWGSRFKVYWTSLKEDLNHMQQHAGSYQKDQISFKVNICSHDLDAA
ncbi:hypothetical protein TURU_010622 [Turdus rufiventris]|nr:hypothetical protein TURU_010622 [Turdus rufiventris]